MTNNKSTLQNIDDYIADFPEDAQALLQKVRATIRKAAEKWKKKVSTR